MVHRHLQCISLELCASLVLGIGQRRTVVMFSERVTLQTFTQVSHICVLAILMIIFYSAILRNYGDHIRSGYLCYNLRTVSCIECTRYDDGARAFYLRPNPLMLHAACLRR